MTDPTPAEALKAARGYCDNCGCDSCRQFVRDINNRHAVERDAQSRCWSCSCGWVMCYTRAEIAEYGEPPECGHCYRERLVECDPPTALSPPDAGEVRTYREGVSGEWQEIETAPKDATQQKEGTRILLLWPNGEISIGRWRFNHRTNTYYFTDSEEWDDYETADYPPTHWHPVPAPPAAAIRKLP